MRTKRRGLGGGLLLGASLVAGPGCLTLSQAPTELPPDCVTACQQVPVCSRGKVFVFLIDGCDPLCGVASVRNALIGLGFNKVYDGHFYHALWFADEMRRLHAEEPDARFAVVGFSTEAGAARALVESVAKDGITVDLLAVVDGPLWSAAKFDKPANVGEFVVVPDSANAAQPLAEELCAIAGTVPVIVPVVPPPADELPTPRPVAKRSVSPRDAWDFLMPVTRLDQPQPADITPPPPERSAMR